MQRNFGNARLNAFTLIELLTVMTVMVLVTSIAVTSGFGMRKSATYTSARELPVNILEYAHQRACMDGRRTAVLIAPADSSVKDQYEASVFQIVGEVSAADQSGITDAYSDLAATVVNGKFLTAFSFKNGGLFHVGEIKSEVDNAVFKTQNGGKGDFAADGKANKYQHPKIVIKPVRGEKVPTSGFKAGDAYGFEIADRMHFPKNFAYTCESGGHASGNGGFYVVFEPDGNIEPVKIAVTESNNSESKFKAFITVEEGKILVKRER